MEIKKVSPGIFAVDRPGSISNLGFIRTAEGVVLIDTTSNKVEMKEVMDNAGLAASDVCLVITTHADPDHVGGNILFDCPILAHRIALERMAKRTQKAQPTDTFEDRHTTEVGGVRMELIYKGGHKADSIVVWLPESKVLFSGDLIFEGRYPWMREAHVPTWMEALRWLPSLGAEVIVPGHGAVCGYEAVSKQLTYMEETWERTARHIAEGHGLKQTLNDPDYPKNQDWDKEKLFKENIELMYKQLKGK